MIEWNPTTAFTKKRQKKKENNEIPGEGDILEADEVDSLPVKGKW